MSVNNLTRIEIANFINKEIGVSRSESSFFVDSIVNEMIQGLKEQKILKISSFGTLKLRYKKKRIGRNPKTGTKLSISARNTISFIASKILKNKVNS